MDERRALQRSCWNDLHRNDGGSAGVPDQIISDAVKGILPGRALDLGCGSGTIALRLAASGWDVTGIDWSEEAIRRARAAAIASGTRATFHVADMTTWRSTERFELVVCTYALPAGELAHLALATASIALVPGGMLLVVEWDQSMAGAWRCDEEELFTPDRIAGWLPELRIEEARVRTIEGVSPPASVAFVRAIKPCEAPSGERQSPDGAAAQQRNPAS